MDLEGDFHRLRQFRSSQAHFAHAPALGDQNVATDRRRFDRLLVLEAAPCARRAVLVPGRLGAVVVDEVEIQLVPLGWPAGGDADSLRAIELTQAKNRYAARAIGQSIWIFGRNDMAVIAAPSSVMRFIGEYVKQDFRFKQNL